VFLTHAEKKGVAIVSPTLPIFTLIYTKKQKNGRRKRKKIEYIHLNAGKSHRERTKPIICAPVVFVWRKPFTGY